MRGSIAHALEEEGKLVFNEETWSYEEVEDPIEEWIFQEGVQLAEDEEPGIPLWAPSLEETEALYNALEFAIDAHDSDMALDEDERQEVECMKELSAMLRDRRDMLRARER